MHFHELLRDVDGLEYLHGVGHHIVLLLAERIDLVDASDHGLDVRVRLNLAHVVLARDAYPLATLRQELKVKLLLLIFYS